MAIARVQYAYGGADGAIGTTIDAVFGSSVTAGSLIVVGVRSTADRLAAVTDSLGTSYSLAVQDVSGDPCMWIYYGIAPSSGSNTVTATSDGLNFFFGWCFAIEVSGIASTSPLDVFDAKRTSFGSVPPLESNSFNTAHASEYIASFASQSNFASYTAGSGYTMIDGSMPTNPSDFGGAMERITSGTLTGEVATFVSTVVDGGCVVTASFKAAASGNPWHYYAQQ